MGAPVGNSNAANAKVWKAAISRALNKRSKAAGKEAIDDLAEKLLALCEDGNLGALQELGNRLDGKSVQGIEGTGPGGIIQLLLSNDDKSVL